MAAFKDARMTCISTGYLHWLSEWVKHSWNFLNEASQDIATGSRTHLSPAYLQWATLQHPCCRGCQHLTWARKENDWRVMERPEATFLKWRWTFHDIPWVTDSVCMLDRTSSKRPRCTESSEHQNQDPARSNKFVNIMETAPHQATAHCQLL